MLSLTERLNGEWVSSTCPLFAPQSGADARSDSLALMKRQHAEAAGDRLALAGQSGCDVPAQPGGKARALPACDSSASAEEEPALHAARMPEAQASGALPTPMTVTLALRLHAESKARPYQANVWRDGKHINLGCFETAEEAALHVARSPEGQAQAKAEALAQAKAEAKAQAQAKAEAKAQAKQAAKAEAVRAREEQKRLFEQHRQQLEEQRRQMAAHQAQLLRAAAEAQRQRKQGGAPRPAAAASGASPAPAAAAEPATGSTDALVQQVLRRGGCPFRCLGLERGTSQEGVRKRYLALALRLHPDKAQHPQADEAFAALEDAYSRARDAAAAADAAG